MHLSPLRSWMTGITLSGVLLTSVLTPIAPQAKNVNSLAKPVLLSNQSLNFSQSLLNMQHNKSNATSDLRTIANEFQYSAQSPSAYVLANDLNSKSISLAYTSRMTQEAEHKIQPVINSSFHESSTIVDYALSLLGTPYVFGGTSRKGFDCSAYTRYVFAEFGKALPRTSYEQFASGTMISKDKLQPGDLVFFSTYAKGPSHVGIYIGGGSFVQASNPHDGVKVTSLNDSFYSSRYLGARRYI